MIRQFSVVTLVGVAALAGCTNGAPGDCSASGDCDAGPPPEPPRVFVSPPFGLGFDCVTIGCSQSQMLHVQNRGGGTVKVERIAFTSATSEDFELELPGAPPFNVTRDAPLDVPVSYVPSDGVADTGSVRISYVLEPAQGPAPEPLSLPLRTRTLGGPRASVPEELNFGFVAPGEVISKELVVTNVSLATSVLTVTGALLDPDGDDEFHVLTPLPVFANMEDASELAIRFAPPLDPTSARTFKGILHLATNDEANPDLAVRLIGTAREAPQFTIEPQDNASVLLLGSVAVGAQLEATLTLRNVGGQDLLVAPSLVGDTGTGFAIEPSVGQLPAIPSFERGTVLVRYAALVGGPALGPGGVVPQLRLQTNDPDRPDVRIRLEAFGILPHATPSVSRVDFGGVVVNWAVEPQQVLLRNTGAGPLSVTDVLFEPGTSAQFLKDAVGGLPATLLPEDAPLVVTLRFNPITLGPATGTLVFSTNDPESPLRRVPLTGRGISCEEGCPIPNATPQCGTGACTIGSCTTLFHDADGLGINGCECREDDGGDVGAVCGGGERNLGTLNDSGQSRTVSGTLHDVDDQDTYWFFAEDEGGAGQLFGDDFDARIELINTPSNIEMCVRQASHDVQGQGCGSGGEECGKRYVRKDGSYGSDDNTDFTIRVRFVPGSAPTCGTYTVKVQNG